MFPFIDVTLFLIISFSSLPHVVNFFHLLIFLVIVVGILITEIRLGDYYLERGEYLGGCFRNICNLAVAPGPEKPLFGFSCCNVLWC